MVVRQVLGAGAAPLHGTVAGASRAGGRSGTSSEARAGEHDFFLTRANRILGGSRACAVLFWGQRSFTVGCSSDPAVMSLITAGSCYEPTVMPYSTITNGSCYEPAVMHLITVGFNSRYGHQLWNRR